MSDEVRDASTIDATFAPRLSDEVAFVPVADRAALYVEATGFLHQLDPIGATVCGLFDGATPIATVAAELAAAFEDDPAVVQADVLAFVRELGAAGLIEGIAADEVTTEP